MGFKISSIPQSSILHLRLNNIHYGGIKDTMRKDAERYKRHNETKNKRV